MPKTIKMPLSNSGTQSTLKEIAAYKEWVLRKEKEFRVRLAAAGATAASIQFSRAIYNGSGNVSVRVDDAGGVAVIYAEGDAVAFIEFGAGAKYGYGHPQAAEFGVGPGTYPDAKGHWDDPNGWYYGHNKHSYGNPPAMAMYGAVQKMEEELTTIAREVFRT